MMGVVAIIGILAAISLFYLAFRPRTKPPSRSSRRIPPSVPHIEEHLAALEVRAASLQQSLDSLSDEELQELVDEPDPSTDAPAAAADCAACARAPAFAFGPANINLLIDYYTSPPGQWRELTVHAYRYDGTHGTIRAHCHHRRAGRTFYFSRIRQACDPRTGETITALGPWLDAQYADTDAGIADAALDMHAWALEALFYLAKADRAFRAAEKNLIHRFLTEAGVESKTATAIVGAIAKWGVPSARRYGVTLTQLKGSPLEYRLRVLHTARAILACDRTTHPAEERALARMEKELHPPK